MALASKSSLFCALGNNLFDDVDILHVQNKKNVIEFHPSIMDYRFAGEAGA